MATNEHNNISSKSWGLALITDEGQLSLGICA